MWYQTIKWSNFSLRKLFSGKFSFEKVSRDPMTSDSKISQIRKKGVLEISENVKNIISLHPKGLGIQLEVRNMVLKKPTFGQKSKISSNFLDTHRLQIQKYHKYGKTASWKSLRMKKILWIYILRVLEANRRSGTCF